MEEKIKKGDTKVKCRYCKNSIYKSKSFTNPDKPRMYYCNEECFNNAIKELSAKSWNAVVRAGLKACGYIDKQRIKSVVVQSCDCEEAG